MGCKMVKKPFHLNDDELEKLKEDPSKFSSIDELVFHQDDFPEDVCKLTHLKKLWVNIDSGILPESIGNLVNLRELYLWHCYLDDLPDAIGKLVNLKVLQVSDNFLKGLPESFGNLPNLSVFAVMSNNLNSLPESFENYEIDSVFIHNNQIAELPVALFDNSFDVFVIQENNLQLGSIEPFMDNGMMHADGLRAQIIQLLVVQLLEVNCSELAKFDTPKVGENV